jgi:phosphinothricin acetyltransferase
MNIRLATSADASAINAIYRPFVTGSAVSFELEPPTDAAMAGRMAETLKRFPWLVAEDAAGIAGYAYGARHRDRAAYQWSVETSVYVHPERRRTGVARALYGELFARLETQGYFTAFAGISLPNAASVGLHVALGFEPVGVYRRAGFKFGAWHDVGWWQKPLRNYTVPAAAPMLLHP